MRQSTQECEHQGEVSLSARLSSRDRIEHASLTTIELVIFWGVIGAVLYLIAERGRGQAAGVSLS